METDTHLAQTSAHYRFLYTIHTRSCPIHFFGRSTKLFFTSENQFLVPQKQIIRGKKRPIGNGQKFELTVLFLFSYLFSFAGSLIPPMFALFITAFFLYFLPIFICRISHTTHVHVGYKRTHHLDEDQPR